MYLNFNSIFCATGKSRSRGLPRQLDSINTVPLVSTALAESPTPKLTKEILIVDIAPNEVCSMRFSAFLRNLPKFSVVCYIDHLESVNQNMYDWAHKKLKTCDFIIIVLTSELTDLFDSDTNNILQSSPFSDIVKYFLSQMNSSAYTNDSAKYCSVLNFLPVSLNNCLISHLRMCSLYVILQTTRMSTLLIPS